MSTANPTTLLQEYLHLGHLNVTNRIKIKCQQKRFYQDSPLLFFHVMFSSVYSTSHFDHGVCTFSTAWFKSAI